jgi:hypothetical protein
MRASLAVVCILALVVAAPAAASHTTFSASADRVEIDGNAFGPLDGTPDEVDEFDDGTIGPGWAPFLGTADESGGVVTFHDPGFDYPVGSVRVDVSDIEFEEPAVNGSGSFTATVYWVQAIPGVDRQFHVQLYVIGATMSESVGLAFTNLSGATAAAQGPGSVAGPAVTQQVARYDGVSFTTPYLASTAVDPGDVTGRIVLRLAFDDASDTFTGAFSLDGGATFQSPFGPMPVSTASNDLELVIGAGLVAPVLPASIQLVPLKVLTVQNPGVPERRKVIFQTKAPTGVVLRGDPLSRGATFTLSLDDQSQCFRMPAVGWTHTATGYRYRRPGPFGTGPVASAYVKVNNNGTFKSKVLVVGRFGSIDVIPPSTQGDTSLLLGDAAYCSSTAGGSIAVNDARAFKVKDAPAPASCNTAICSPSGAFLD